MEYSEICDVLMVQVMYKSQNTPIQCHFQNAECLSFVTALTLLILWCSVLDWVYVLQTATRYFFMRISNNTCLVLGMSSKILCGYFLSVMRAVILSHLVLDTTNCLFTTCIQWLIFSGTFRLRTAVITSTAESNPPFVLFKV